MNESTDLPERRSCAGAWFTAWACVVVGFLIMAWSDFGTSEFMALGAFLPWVLSGFFAVLLIPVLAVASWIMKRLARRGWLPACFNSTTIKLFDFVVLAAQIAVAVLSSQPRNRLAEAMGGECMAEGEVRVIGFNGFLAGRWLFEFTIDPARLDSVRHRLGMREIEPYDLPANLRRDVILASRDSSIVKSVPGPEGVRMFREEQEDKDSGRWSVLVYRASDGRSWLYKGFQN